VGSGVVEAERLGDAPVGEGTEFRVVADFLGRKAALTYRTIALEPDRAVMLRGENATVVSLDWITFEPSDGGTRPGPRAGRLRRREGRAPHRGARATTADNARVGAPELSEP
jgi:hypothetical protein